MKKMRNTYAVSFIKLVDSTWTPKAEMETFRGIKLRGSYDHIRVKSSADYDPVFEPIDVLTFKTKDEFVGHMVKNAIEAWDNYEAEKQFNKERQDIVEDLMNDINQGKPAEQDSCPGIDGDERIKELYKINPLKINASEEEIISRVKEIRARDTGGWEPYIIMREIYGLDFIRTPDIATEENIKEMHSKRPSVENNNGIVRRSKQKRIGRGVESESSNNR